jgi:hypothetical protein
MKNTKKTLGFFFKIWMYFCTTIVTGIFLLLVFYNIAIWVTLDFDPYFMQIDSCMDEGGVWEDDLDVCMRATSPFDLCMRHGGAWNHALDKCEEY